MDCSSGNCLFTYFTAFQNPDPPRSPEFPLPCRGTSNVGNILSGILEFIPISIELIVMYFADENMENVDIINEYETITYSRIVLQSN